jgi:hypothetical protein
LKQSALEKVMANEQCKVVLCCYDPDDFRAELATTNGDNPSLVVPTTVIDGIFPVREAAAVAFGFNSAQVIHASSKIAKDDVIRLWAIVVRATVNVPIGFAVPVKTVAIHAESRPQYSPSAN